MRLGIVLLRRFCDFIAEAAIFGFALIVVDLSVCAIHFLRNQANTETLNYQNEKY